MNSASLAAALAGMVLLWAASKKQAAQADAPATASGIITPTQAQALISAGRVSDVWNAKVSQFFAWSETARNQNELKEAARRGILSNIARHARNLDRVRAAYGSPIYVISWFRPESRTTHGQGLGTDFAGSRAVHLGIWNAAVRVGWRGGRGITANPNASIFKLHLDSGSLRSWTYDNAGRDTTASIPLRNLYA